ncbi:hypothetical protein N9K25_00190 [Candidatus Pelagibacter sp.]|nr:hypothetical protein [Candidatus Pelagibacter sp.]
MICLIQLFIKKWGDEDFKVGVFNLSPVRLLYVNAFGISLII